MYEWAVGTRRLTEESQIITALCEMDKRGGKWSAFSTWLLQNKAALMFWFVYFFKKKHNSTVGGNIMSSSNPNKSDNSRVKRSAEYKLTNSKGLKIVEVVSLLKEIDTLDSNNIDGLHGRQSITTPLFRVRGTKRKGNKTESVLLDEKLK